MMENNKTNLPVSKVGRVNIRPLLAKDGVHYQLRIVIPKEMRRDGKREKTERLEKTMDILRKKFGDDIIKR